MQTNFVKDIPNYVRITKKLDGPFFDGKFKKYLGLYDAIPIKMIQ